METIKGKDIRAEDADSEMVRILEEMLGADETITFRALARRHSSIKYASSFSRDSVRAETIVEYKKRQDERRAWLVRTRKRSTADIVAKCADKDIVIADLKQRVEVLTASHKAMSLAVGELGGTEKWLQYFDGFQSARNLLVTMGLIPATEVPEAKLSVNLGGKNGKRKG